MGEPRGISGASRVPQNTTTATHPSAPHRPVAKPEQKREPIMPPLRPARPPSPTDKSPPPPLKPPVTPAHKPVITDAKELDDFLDNFLGGGENKNAPLDTVNEQKQSLDPNNEEKRSSPEHKTQTPQDRTPPNPTGTQPNANSAQQKTADPVFLQRLPQLEVLGEKITHCLENFKSKSPEGRDKNVQTFTESCCRFLSLLGQQNVLYGQALHLEHLDFSVGLSLFLSSCRFTQGDFFAGLAKIFPEACMRNLAGQEKLQQALEKAFQKSGERFQAFAALFTDGKLLKMITADMAKALYQKAQAQYQLEQNQHITNHTKKPSGSLQDHTSTPHKSAIASSAGGHLLDVADKKTQDPKTQEVHPWLIAQQQTQAKAKKKITEKKEKEEKQDNKDKKEKEEKQKQKQKEEEQRRSKKRKRKPIKNKKNRFYSQL